jgi:hypothetical protein
LNERYMPITVVISKTYSKKVVHCCLVHSLPWKMFNVKYGLLQRVSLHSSKTN